MHTKSFFITLLLLVSTIGANAQTLKFKVSGLQDTIVHLVKYSGKGMYYADTTEAVNGIAKFDGSKHETGVYALFLPGQKYFDFIHDHEVVDIEVKDMNDMIGSLTVKKSKFNTAFFDYVNFMTDQKKIGAQLGVEQKTASEERKAEIIEESKAINAKVLAYQKKMVNDHNGHFLADLINLSLDVELPEAPKDEDGNVIDDSYVYQYFINHYWDNVNLNNDAVIRTPLFHKKLEKYLSPEVMAQIPDTISLYADKLIAKTDDSSLLFQYIVAHITSKAEQSPMMGMENVFVHMVDKYYAVKPTRTPWMSEENLEKVVTRVNEIRPSMVGAIAPRLCLPDSTEQNWVDLYKVDSDYKILFFWEPTCGHCKKAAPKLQDLYAKKFKERNVEIYAVGKAMGDDFEKWKSFIVNNGLEFINVGLTKSVYEEAQENAYYIIKNHNTTIESLNYTKTYDVASTPRIFVLDKDNKILYKRVSISQLEEIMDNIQGVPNAEKLYPIEEEDPEDRLRASEQ